MLIRFLQRDAPWDAGQEDDFGPEVAEKLVRHGVAEHVEPPPPPAKKSKKADV